MPTPLSRAHRSDLRALTDLAERDLAALWGQVDRAETARDALMDILPRLVSIYGAAAATLAADYFDDARDAAGVAGRFTAIAAETTPPAALEVLAKVAVGPLFQATPDFASALVIAKGGLQRHVANADRETVRFSAIQDPRAQGWVRVGNGGCDWCRQYLDGEVHHVEGYDFNAHDHCNCTAEPVFG